MSYRFKGQVVSLEGDTNKIVPKALSTTPTQGEICVDASDKKLKVWNATLTRWIILGDARDVVFDNSTNGFVADNVQDAIEEIKNSGSGQGSRHIITLSRNGAVQNTWLSIGDHSTPSNASPWTPPFNCQILKVAVTNKKSGTSQNILRTKVDAFCVDFGSDGNITTGDPLGFYVYSDGENLVQTGDYGRMWIYDNSSEGDYLYMSKQYGFRFKKIEGPSTPNDVVVTLLVEEI